MSFFRPLPFCTLALGLGLCARPAHADLLSFFDFNSGSLSSTAGIRSSSLSNNFGAGGVSVAGNGGTTLGADAGGAGSTAGGSLDVFNQSGFNSNAGKYLQFGLNTSGYQNVIVSLATQDANGFGFNNNQFQYSTDGSTYTNFNSPYSTSTTYAAKTFDLSSVTGLNNNANASFRIVFGGGFAFAGNENRIDNLAINGAVMATPEPQTWAMMGLGLASLAMVGWRRKRGEVEAV